MSSAGWFCPKADVGRLNVIRLTGGLALLSVEANVSGRSTVSEGRVERRLAAILAADVAGYSRLIGEDEEGTLGTLRTMRREMIDPAIAEHRGRIVKTTGDGLLAEFASVIDAVRCAAAWQEAVPRDSQLIWRIGVHQGDIVAEDDDIFGDGVNVAARLEALAEPGGICVSARVQEDASGRLDVSFDDLGEHQLKNIARPVRVFRVRLGRSAEAPAAAPALALPDKPSIAVLPFRNVSDDPEQEYFADGMVEEIITALCRVRWLFVIARNSSFTYKGKTVDVKRVGRELGVRYVLEGSVRKARSRVRITAQLIEAETSAHLWADRFDGSLEEVFDLQDQVARSVAGVIEPALQAAEITRASRRPTNDLTAHDLYLRSADIGLSSAAQMPEALHLVEEAIDRDPQYGPALAWAAICCTRLVSDNLSQDPEADRNKAAHYARQALKVSADDPSVLANAPFALAYLGEDINAMIALVDRALALNPSYARGWHVSGYLRGLAGDDPDLCIEHLEMALRLSPRRVGTTIFLLGAAYFCKRRFEEAVPKLILAIQEDPTNPAPRRVLAACYAQMGRLVEARHVVEQLRALTPVLLGTTDHIRNPEHRDLLVSGMRLAAGELQA